MFERIATRNESGDVGAHSDRGRFIANQLCGGTAITGWAHFSKITAAITLDGQWRFRKSAFGRCPWRESEKQMR
jgi:hypothetical protein